MAPVAADPTIRRQVVAAARHVLSSDPEAPIGEIARKAGVSRATFYRHFGSRGALLESIAHEPRPPARERVLVAAQEALLHTSLSDLSMDELARAADVSRGTLYRLFPGKPALLEALVETYSPFDAVRSILHEHRDDPPAVVLPLIAGAIAGAAGQRLGLMRAIFVEVTALSPAAVAALRPAFMGTIGALGEYLAAQMAVGRIRQMHPMLAVQAFIGPVFFHLMTRPVLERMTPLPASAEHAVDELTASVLEGLANP
ncbi:MAG: TetR/AcrR family transcriptional regulator [Candidatus Limnocylindrales bacterium]